MINLINYGLIRSLIIYLSKGMYLKSIKKKDPQRYQSQSIILQLHQHQLPLIRLKFQSSKASSKTTVIKDSIQ